MSSVSRCRYGQPHDVLEQVGGDRRLGVVTGIVPPAFSTAPVLARLALEEVLTDQRLRPGDWQNASEWNWPKPF